jgi:hypothetical protein
MFRRVDTGLQKHIVRPLLTGDSDASFAAELPVIYYARVTKSSPFIGQPVVFFALV